MRRLVIFVVLPLALVACGDDDADGPAAASDTTTSETTETTVPTDQSAVTAQDPGSPDDGADPPVFVASLEGSTQVPGPGDDGATGRVEIQADAEGVWCFDMVATGLDSDVVDSHIHTGDAGDSGGVVIAIGPPTESDDVTDTWTDVCVPVDDERQAEITADPDAFYANIHTESFGAGAIRGQLEAATVFDLTLS